MSDSSVATNPAGAQPNSGSGSDGGLPAIDILSLRVNASAVLACVLLIFIGVKITSFLPDKLYFSFSRMVDSTNSPFLIQPPHLSEQQLCELLKEKNLKYLRCAEEEADQASPEPTPEELEKIEKEREREAKIAESLVRERIREGGILDQVLSLTIRLTVPLIAGFLIGRIFAAEGIAAAGLGGALAALLSCWPVIVLWDRVVTFEWQSHYKEFIALYVFYIVLYYFVAQFGAIVGARMAPGRWKVPINSQKIIESVIGAMITGISVKVIERVILS